MVIIICVFEKKITFSLILVVAVCFLCSHLGIQEMHSFCVIGKLCLKCFDEGIAFVECFIADVLHKPAEVDETEIDGKLL